MGVTVFRIAVNGSAGHNSLDSTARRKDVELGQGIGPACVVAVVCELHGIIYTAAQQQGRRTSYTTLEADTARLNLRRAESSGSRSLTDTCSSGKHLRARVI